MITHAPVVVSRANKKLSGRQSNFRVGDKPLQAMTRLIRVFPNLLCSSVVRIPELIWFPI
jgi:hypothetical protein